MDTFHVTMKSPKGIEKLFTGVADSFEEIRKDAEREYPRHVITEIENATTGETKEFRE